MAIYTPFTDPDATTQTKSYLEKLQKKVDAAQTDYNEKAAAAAAAEAEEKYEKSYYQQAHEEYTIAEKYLEDAQAAKEKFETLDQFFKDRLKDVGDAHDMAQKTAAQIFTAAAKMSTCTQTAEATVMVATEYNKEDQEGQQSGPQAAPYTQVFFKPFNEFENSAKTAFKAVNDASKSAFTALGTAKRSLVMANYLYSGIHRTYENLERLLAQAENLYQAAYNKYTVAKVGYEATQILAAKAKTAEEEAKFLLDMYTSELKAGVKGAAGLASGN